MKVAFVLGTSTGGTARHVRMLAGGYAARGVAAEVFGPAQTDRDFGFSAQAGFIPVEIADRPRVLRDLRAIARLRRLIRAWRPDVVHAHGLRAGALTAIALTFVRPDVYHPRPALVVTVHNAPAAGGVTGAIYRVLELIVARTADSVLCVSPDLEERMRASGARRVGRALVPADAVPVPQDAGRRRAAATGNVSAETRVVSFAGPGRPTVLAVGRLAAQKGFGTLLDAAASWRDMRPEPLLVIVGDGPLEAGLTSQAARLKLDVRFPPPCWLRPPCSCCPACGRASRSSCRKRCGPACPSSPPESAARPSSPARTPPCSFLRVRWPRWPMPFARCSPTRRWPPGCARRPPTARVPCRPRTTR